MKYVSQGGSGGSQSIIVDLKQEIVPKILDDINIPFPSLNGNVIATLEAQLKVQALKLRAQM